MFVMTLSRRMNIYVIAFPSMAIIFAKLAYTQEEFQIQKSCLLTDSFIFGLRIDLFLVYNICLWGCGRTPSVACYSIFIESSHKRQ